MAFNRPSSRDRSQPVPDTASPLRTGSATFAPMPSHGHRQGRGTRQRLNAVILYDGPSGYISPGMSADLASISLLLMDQTMFRREVEPVETDPCTSSCEFRDDDHDEGSIFHQLCRLTDVGLKLKSYVYVPFYQRL